MSKLDRRAFLSILPAAPVAVFTVPPPAQAPPPAKVILPTFYSGDMLRAADFNQAFKKIADAINDLATRQVPAKDV